MPDKYYQEYGPISRRRRTGELTPDEPAPTVEPIEGAAMPREWQRRALQRPRRRGRRKFVLLLALVAAGVGAFAVLPFVLGLWSGDRAQAGVSLQGQSMAGKSRAEVRALAEQRYAAFLRTPITIAFEGRSWSPTLAQLGVRFEPDKIAADVLAAGHRGGPITRISELWQIWRGGLDIAPQLSVDARALQGYLNTIAVAVELPPRDAALSIAEGQVLPTPSRPGRQALADLTTLEVLRALQTLEPQTVLLRTRTLAPRLPDTALAPAAAEAQALLSKPLTLRSGDQSWVWQPTKIAELLAVQAEAGRMRVSIDPDRLGKAVQKLAQLVDTGTSEPRLAFRAGKVTIARPGQAGLKLRQDQAAQAISQTLRLATRELALPVQELAPQVTATTLPTLGIVELVGEGKTSFAGSAAYRITNIKAGAARMDGVLIAPGEEFSFNTQLGAVDESNGFVQGYAVIGNRTQLEWGGGVCQDSTTVFRAAFWAGLPITERHAHPFYISWYDDYSFPNESGPGMDATIFTGVLDLKFLNDTGHWLLMEASVDEGAQVLTVRLYGTKPDRTVVAKGPEITQIIPAPSEPVYVNDDKLPAGTVKQTDTARRGMDIAVYRVITEQGVQKTPETFFTRFKAWPNVFARGTAQ